MGDDLNRMVHEALDREANRLDPEEDKAFLAICKGIEEEPPSQQKTKQGGLRDEVTRFRKIEVVGIDIVLISTSFIDFSSDDDGINRVLCTPRWAIHSTFVYWNTHQKRALLKLHQGTSRDDFRRELAMLRLALG